MINQHAPPWFRNKNSQWIDATTREIEYGPPRGIMDLKRLGGSNNFVLGYYNFFGGGRGGGEEN